MIIKTGTFEDNTLSGFGGKFPDLFVSDAKKNSKKYIKSTIDYFQDYALREYKNNAETFCENYRFLKGELRAVDFYECEDEDVRSFYSDLVDENNKLPSYVQQYSILNTPINTMWGEYIEKPDNVVVKAFDADSKSEELEYMTDMMVDYGTKMIQAKIFQKAADAGVDLADEEVIGQLQQELQKQVAEGLDTFSTQGEKWANRILEALKRLFNIKDHAGQGFRDLMITGRNRFHIREDNSSLGFTVENVNPKNVWKYMDVNEKYLKKSVYAGLIEVKDITDIMNMVKLTDDEIEQLREESRDMYLNPGVSGESNLFNNKTGIDSITYNSGIPQPHRSQEQFYAESALTREERGDNLFFQIEGSNIIGQKHIVVTAYWQAKKKVGELTYIDQYGQEQKTFVNDTYKSREHPGELELEWSWVNEWWKGLKIGNCVYICEPLKILDYCPILGIEFDGRNSPIKSMVDLMKPYQMIFNLCMNQLWEILSKEKGVLFEFNQRHIPTDKDVSFEDSLSSWLAKAEELGFIFSDDSLENTKSPSTTNTNVSKRIDLSRHQEMQSRLSICQQIKLECHALVGINPERQGGIAATQTATGTQAALSSSYSQTQIWFEAQQIVMNDVYQAMIDVAQYFESDKEVSTISYLNDAGDRAFFEVAGSDLKFRDFGCIITSQTEDARKLESLRAMSQNLLQNGADFYTVSKLQVTNSIREIQSEFKKDKERREQQQNLDNQMKQQQLQQQQEAVKAQIQQQQQSDAAKIANDNYNKQLDRISRERVALLNASGRDAGLLNDADGNGTADALEATSMDNEILMANKQHALEQSKLDSQNAAQQRKNVNDSQKTSQDYKLKSRELDIKEKEINQRAEQSKIDLKIAKTNKN